MLQVTSQTAVTLASPALEPLLTVHVMCNATEPMTVVMILRASALMVHNTNMHVTTSIINSFNQQ